MFVERNDDRSPFEGGNATFISKRRFGLELAALVNLQCELIDAGSSSPRPLPRHIRERVNGSLTEEDVDLPSINTLMLAAKRDRRTFPSLQELVEPSVARSH